jgi:hypothetical protein
MGRRCIATTKLVFRPKPFKYRYVTKSETEPRAKTTVRLGAPGRLNAIVLPPAAFTPDLSMAVLRYHFVYSLFGLGFGFATAAGGLMLFVMGVAGRSTFLASLLQAKIEITDAAPGAILAAIGLLLVAFTRFDVRPSVPGGRAADDGRTRLPKAG